MNQNILSSLDVGRLQQLVTELLHVLLRVLQQHVLEYDSVLHVVSLVVIKLLKTKTTGDGEMVERENTLTVTATIRHSRFWRMADGG